MKLVISYRRQDSDAIAGRIRDRLVSEFGEDSVFMDIDSIPIGVNFREYIAGQLENSDVVFVIIGSTWLGDRKRGKRIQNAADPVRIEVEKAFDLGIPIWPILVNHAAMPDPDKLPDSLKALADCNAAVVDSGVDFHSHMDRLVRQLNHQLGRKVGESGHARSAEALDPGLQNNSTPRTSKRVIAAMIVLFVIVVAVAAGAVFPRLSSTGSAPNLSGSVASSQLQAGGVIHVPSGAVDCSEEAHLRSQGTTQPTTISFTDKATDTKRIYWLNFNGVRVLYGTLQTGQAISIQTYITHPWVVATSSDACEAIYMPTTAVQNIEIDN